MRPCPGIVRHDGSRDAFTDTAGHRLRRPEPSTGDGSGGRSEHGWRRASGGGSGFQRPARGTAKLWHRWWTSFGRTSITSVCATDRTWVRRSPCWTQRGRGWTAHRHGPRRQPAEPCRRSTATRRLPCLLSRIDRIFVNAPVRELLGGDARASYTTPVLDRDPPSDDAPLALVLFRTPARTRRTFPRWAPAHPVFQEFMREALSAIAPSSLGPSAAIAETGHVAQAILPEVGRSCVLPGSAMFVSRPARRGGADDPSRLRSALDHVPAHASVSLSADGGILDV